MRFVAIWLPHPYHAIAGSDGIRSNVIKISKKPKKQAEKEGNGMGAEMLSYRYYHEAGKKGIRNKQIENLRKERIQNSATMLPYKGS
jgi:hypothetical protein